MSSLRLETRRLGVNSLLYLVPSLLVRGLTVFLTPIYTRHMSVAEYGAIALANTVSGLLVVLLGLGLASSITRLHHECVDDRERQTFYSTLLLFTATIPMLAAVGLETLGRMGFFDHVFRAVPFDPYLRLAVWTAVLNLFSGIASGLFATREEPGWVAVMNVGAALTQTLATVVLVVLWNQGAVGALRAGLVAAGSSTVVALVLLRRYLVLRFSWRLLLLALSYAVPLIPHTFSHWILSVSDRLILERHVSQADLGLYSLGYLFSFVVVTVVAAVASAITPMITRSLKADPGAPHVPRLGTYAIAAMTFAALGAAALGGDAIRIIAPPTYEGAVPVVPWVVLGALMQGVYTVWSQGTWFSMNTRAMPIVTLIGAGMNVVLNLLLVPRYGIMAAAVNTAIGYTILAGLHGLLAHRLFPIPWEYRRWAVILIVALTAFFITAALPRAMPVAAGIALRLLIVGLLFPCSLFMLRVFNLSEFRRFREG